MILNMLKNKILKENFQKIKAGMRDMIVVYLTDGRNANKLLGG